MRKGHELRCEKAFTFPVMGTGYGAVHQAGAVHHRRGSGQGGGLLRARAAVAAALCLSGLAALLAYQVLPTSFSFALC